MTTTLITPAPGPAASPRRSKRASQGPVGGRGGGDAWKLVLPCLLPVMLFSVYPLLRGIYLGFTDAEAGLNATTTFTGLENYRNLRGYDLFWDSFRIGLIWTVSVTTLQFFLSLALALLLNLDLKLRWLARTLALVPWAIPPVIVAIMWRLMLHPRSGAVNKVLRELGFAGDTNWLGDFKYALPAAILVGVWSGMPQTTITLLAGLQSVPEELNEAAAIDGAGVGAALLPRHAPGAAPDHPRHHHARPDQQLQLVRPRLHADRRRPGRQDDAALAVRLQRGVPVRALGLRRGDGQRDGDRRRHVPRPLPLGRRPTRSGSSMITGRHRRVTRPLQYLALGAFMVFLAFPVVYLLITALKPQSELLDPEPSFLPKEFEWSNFTEAIDKTRFWTTARNSAVVATVTMTVTIVLAMPAAYALARFRTKLRGLATGWILLSQVFPFILIIIPLFMVLRDLELIDTLIGLVAVYTVWSLPFALWMLRGYIAGIPADLEEAGAMDGASRFTVLRKIILPLLAPGLVATALFTFISSWNEFFFALVLIQSPERETLPLTLANFVGAEGQVALGELAAASLLAAIPSLAFFAVIQRRLTSGLLSGAVKG